MHLRGVELRVKFNSALSANLIRVTANEVNVESRVFTRTNRLSGMVARNSFASA